MPKEDFDANEWGNIQLNGVSDEKLWSTNWNRIKDKKHLAIVGKKIISYFSEKNNKILEELKKKELEIKEKENKLIAQKNLLQETEFKKKVDLIKEEINKFNDLSKSKINQLNVEKQTVSKAFLNEINKVIKEYAEKNKIDMIFSSNQMLIGKSSLDLTENILQNVNKNIKNFEIN